MTKKFEFDWRIPVPEPLLKGCIFDRWSEDKDSSDLEPSCLFKVDEYGFFIYWKSEGRVRNRFRTYCTICTITFKIMPMINDVFCVIIIIDALSFFQRILKYVEILNTFGITRPNNRQHHKNNSSFGRLKKLSLFSKLCFIKDDHMGLGMFCLPSYA